MLGSKKKIIAYPLTLLCGLGLIAFLIIARPQPESRVLAPAPVPVVSAVKVKESLRPLVVKSQGVVSAAKRIELVAEVSGKVVKIEDVFAPGGHFSADNVLLELDDTDYRTALSRAEANVADARRLLAVEQGSAKQAQREWRDLKSEEANALFLREPQIASAKANLDAAISARDKARADLSRTKITVPFDGSILRQEVDLGEFIVAGRVIGEAFATDSAEIRLPLSTTQFYQLGNSIGAEVLISSRTGDINHQWSARIVRVESSVDPVTRMHHVVASVENAFASDNTKPALALGQYVEASIKTLDEYTVYELPRSALRQPQDIWILDNENVLHVLSVDVVFRDAKRALIRLRDDEHSRNELLEAGHTASKPLRVVTSNLALAYSGMQTAVEG